MNSDTVLDYAQFKLSPRRTRCELFISAGGKPEKLASGLLKPFSTHLKVVEEQANRAVQSIKLEVEKQKNARTWFNKGTLERFVRFVSTPEVLELVNTFDAEMSQLEGARKIYSQEARNQLSGKLGENESAAAAAADITKKELLRAIDVRLTAVKQDLSTACVRASSAGFTLDTVSELVLFADQFGALRLNEACNKFISLCRQRPELIGQQQSPTLLKRPDWKGFDDANIRSSSDSDMSLDEPEGEPPGPFRTSIIGTAGTVPEPCHPTGGQPPQKSSAETRPTARFLVDKDISKAEEGPSPSTESSEDPVQRAAGGSRRLSVQDRINLFESKQKEQSPTATISGSNSGGGGVNKVVAVKGEHRRQPSDASVEKSVLRRWSGASDMSIDLTNNNINNSLSNDRKESGSTAGTPISSDNSQVQSGSKTEEGAGVLKDMAKSWSRLGPKENSATPCSSSSLSASQIQTCSFPKDGDRCDDLLLREGTATTSKPLPGSFLVKGHADSQTQLFSTSIGRAHQTGFSSETDMQTSSKLVSVSGQGDKLKDHMTSLVQFNGVARQNVGVEDLGALKIPSTAVKATVAKAESNDETGTDMVGVRSQVPSLTKIRTFTGNTEDVRTKPKVPLKFQGQSKASVGKVEGIIQESDLSCQSQWKTHPEDQETRRKKEGTASHMSFNDSLEDDSGSQRMQLHGRISASNLIKLQGKRDERVLNQGTSAPLFSVKRSKELEFLQHSSTPPAEQAQVVRPSKGNNELNDELQTKADELEKLFAAHKLRVHEDQTASSRRSRAMDGQTLKSAEKRPEEAIVDHFSEWNEQSEILSNGVESHTNLLMQMVDNSDSSSGMKQKLSTNSASDDSKGKLYKKYMQKREAKLREEWGMKRAEKEAKMKAMHDSLEHSQAEMKAKLAGSADKRDSILARRRAEKMRSFNVRSAMKNKGQTVEPLQGEEDLQELEQVLYGHDRSYSDTLSGNESSTSSKKLVSGKSLSSSTPRTTAAPIPKPAKPMNAGSIRRRTQLENPLAQSVPNFTDTRKENTKPVTRLSKDTSRAQPRTIARGKSAIEEAIVVKEEKSRRSHSMRKSLAIPGELKDLSPFISDGANLMPQRFPNEQMEQCMSKDPKRSEVKPFLRKGNGIGPGAGAGIAKLKTSTNLEALKDEEDSECLMQYREDSPDIVEGNEEEFDRTSAEGNLQAADFPVESDNESGDPGSENGYVLRSESRDADDPIAESSKFIPSTDNVQESPGGSPGLWNLNSHHSFSYAHEASDIDASVDSPIGSPASWNPHPLNQMMEADAARMRKKWGSAQIPVIVANAPHHQRKDVTKGFKRLLKFGRKSKGAEYLVNDWVSASTTSEGDDDTEDGRELGSRTSDELRKSRMGYTVPAYDSFNDRDTFPEPVQALRSSNPNAPANSKFGEDPLSASSLKAPRSFFSLSSFRSKGG